MKIILSFDIEGDFHKYIHSPYIWHRAKKISNGKDYSYRGNRLLALKNFIKWKLSNQFNRFQSGTKGFENIIEFIKKHKIKASFNLSGYLYLKSPQKIKVELPWAIGKLKRNHFFWQKLDDKNLHFDKLIINSELYKNKLIDWGLHGFIHEAFPLESHHSMDLILTRGVEAGKSLGLRIQTFVPPFNMAFNNNKNEILALMKEKGFKTLRHAGNDDFYNRFSHTTGVEIVKKEKGINLVRLSYSLEGTDNPERVNKLIKKLIENYDEKKVFCIMSHDYTFRNSKNFELLLQELDKLRKKGYKFKFTNLNDL